MSDRTPLFHCKKLTKNFGGLRAVEAVDLALSEGEILGLIGPNGAGKTTLFNLISGVYPVDEGSFFLRGENLTGLLPHQVKKKGISRTFQQSRLILHLSVYDNLFMGMLEGFHSWFWNSLIFRAKFKGELKRAIDKGNQLLSRFNPELVGKGFLPVSEISQIDRRRLEICRALATKPVLLLLDEPSAGMSPEESKELMDDLRRIRENEYRQLSIVLVEHDMAVIEDITERVIALNYGKKIAEGTFEEVSRNQELKEAYLGR